MCFAPQGVALFQHLNFQKCSEPGVSCTFWLGHVVRATTACTFSTAQLQKVAPQRCALFRHHNFQKCSDVEVFLAFGLGNVLRATATCNFFISHLTRWLRTRRFSAPTFRSSGATKHWKNGLKKTLRDFSTFLRACIFFLLTLSLLWSCFLLFSSLTLPTSAFHMSMLSEIWLITFPR